jgi:excisionase family DNA binding protein
MSKLLTIKDICERVRVTRKTVAHWIGTGELRAFKIGSGGRLWRIREIDLKHFIEGQPSKKNKN